MKRKLTFIFLLFLAVAAVDILLAFVFANVVLTELVCGTLIIFETLHTDSSIRLIGIRTIGQTGVFVFAIRI